MKKITRLFICFVLSATLVMGIIPVHSEEIAQTNVIWEQQGDVLYINGTGDMTIDFEYITQIPWYSIRSQITKIVVGEGITSICDSAFADFTLVKEVVLPNSLRTIGPAAFITCSSLSSLVLPYKITEIQDGAFVNCEAMTSIVIPGSILKIADDAFYNCYNLTIVGIADTYANEFASSQNIPFSAGIGPSQEILVRVNDKYVDFDQPPVIIDSRTLVPVRAIFEAMGIAVEWDQPTRTVTATRGNTQIKLTIDSNIMKKTVNGVETTIEIDVPAKILSDRTMVPARAPMENFGASVRWDGATRTVIIQD